MQTKSVWTICLTAIIFVLPFSDLDLLSNFRNNFQIQYVYTVAQNVRGMERNVSVTRCLIEVSKCCGFSVCVFSFAHA